MRSTRALGWSILLGVGALLLPNVARAQYTNNSFALDAGWLYSMKPSSLDATGAVKALSNRPLRLTSFGHVGGEVNFKLDEDKWWMSFRVDLSLSQHASVGSPPNQASYDQQARDALGTMIGVTGRMGVRRYFLTDRFRPYGQLGLSYTRLFTTNDISGENCVSAANICTGTYSNQSEFLPHPNIGAVHVQLGTEMLYERDQGIHVYVDLQRWLIFNAADNHVISVGLGWIFYT